AFPLSVDGVEIVASLRLLADQRIHVSSGWWPWAALVVGTGFSVFANVATAGPGLLDRVIAGWPAAAFLAAVKLLSGMLNRPAALMRRIPIQPERYRRWQDQWADLQATDLSLDEVAARHGVGRRHLTWVRAAGQAGWLDHPDPPAWRLAALGAHPAGDPNTAMQNDQPHNGQPYPGGPSDG